MDSIHNSLTVVHDCSLCRWGVNWSAVRCLLGLLSSCPSLSEPVGTDYSVHSTYRVLLENLLSVDLFTPYGHLPSFLTEIPRRERGMLKECFFFSLYGQEVLHVLM